MVGLVGWQFPYEADPYNSPHLTFKILCWGGFAKCADGKLPAYKRSIVPQRDCSGVELLGGPS